MSNRKKFIKFNNESTNLEIIWCGIPQGSMLRLLLFLIFVNDLQKSTKFLDPIIFAGDTNFFYSNKDLIPYLKSQMKNWMKLMNGSEQINFL